MKNKECTCNFNEETITEIGHFLECPSLPKFNPRKCHGCKKIMQPITNEDGTKSKHTFFCKCVPDRFISIGWKIKNR